MKNKEDNMKNKETKSQTSAEIIKDMLQHLVEKAALVQDTLESKTSPICSFPFGDSGFGKSDELNKYMPPLFDQYRNLINDVYQSLLQIEKTIHLMEI